MFSHRRLFPVLSAFALGSLPVCGSEPPIIAKARAFLGAEAALNAVKSVRYTGTLVTKEPGAAGKEVRAKMEILFQKPEQQRITATSAQTIEVTALDAYDGWQRVTDVSDPAKWRQTLLGTEHVKRLRANTWENLSYYRGIEKVGGRIEDQGTAVKEGVTCQKIAFIHTPQIVFYRYFDVATGRLVFTETETGGTIREQGEIIVNGIRFPKSIVTATKNQAGELQTVTIEFEQVAVNETFPADLFRVPPLGSR